MYGWEKYHLASRGLNNTSADSRQALQYAYIYHILHVQEQDLPEELHQKHNEIVSAVTFPEGVEPIGGHSGCSHAISNLSDEQVLETIEKIHDVYRALEASREANA